jgi:AcrR family transcriptional regulator
MIILKDKSFERREELLEAALSEFTIKSYGEASLNTIIKSAGISKGTFYYHFADKQALYLHLLEVSAAKKWDYINETYVSGPTQHVNNSIFDKFKTQARIAVEFAQKYPKYHELSRMFAQEKGNPIYDVAIIRLGVDSEKLLRSMIEEESDAGSFREEYSKDFLVRTLSYMFTHFHEIYDQKEDFELDRMLTNLDDYVNLIRFGIEKIII